MPYCPNCGTKNEEGASFCVECGTAIEIQPHVRMPRTYGQKFPVHVIIGLGGIAIVAIIALIVLAGGGNVAKDCKRVLENIIQKDNKLRGKIKVTSVNVNKSYEESAFGMTVRTVEFDAEIIYLENLNTTSQLDMGWFKSLEIPYSSKGKKEKVNGEMYFTKTSKGWKGPDDNIDKEDYIERERESSKDFSTARAYDHARICQENLTKIDGAKEQWALEWKVPNGTAVPSNFLDNPTYFGPNGYVKKKPICPAGGIYIINPIGVDPQCSIAIKDPSSQHRMPQ
jgi:hypothetical protein